MFERKGNRQENKTRDSAAGEAPGRAPDDPPRSADRTRDGKKDAAPSTTSKRGTRAMIGSKVKVNGDIVSSEDLLVEGEVTGSITLTENELVIGTSGKVQANINAKTVRIEGEVNGDIESSERVVICASGNVQGNVSAPRVMLEDGGRFKGSIDMGSSKPAAAPKPAPGSSSEVRNIDKTG
jgi:cytoskeletal protein CcmA (bactofilin family)